MRIDANDVPERCIDEGKVRVVQIGGGGLTLE